MEKRIRPIRVEGAGTQRETDQYAIFFVNFN